MTPGVLGAESGLMGMIARMADVAAADGARR